MDMKSCRCWGHYSLWFDIKFLTSWLGGWGVSFSFWDYHAPLGIVRADLVVNLSWKSLYRSFWWVVEWFGIKAFIELLCGPLGWVVGVLISNSLWCTGDRHWIVPPLGSSNLGFDIKLRICLFFFFCDLYFHDFISCFYLCLSLFHFFNVISLHSVDGELSLEGGFLVIRCPRQVSDPTATGNKQLSVIGEPWAFPSG